MKSCKASFDGVAILMNFAHTAGKLETSTCAYASYYLIQQECIHGEPVLIKHLELIECVSKSF